MQIELREIPALAIDVKRVQLVDAPASSSRIRTPLAAITDVRMIQVVVVVPVDQPMNLNAEVGGQVGPNVVYTLTKRSNGLANALVLVRGGWRWHNGLLRLNRGDFTL